MKVLVLLDQELKGTLVLTSGGLRGLLVHSRIRSLLTSLITVREIKQICRKRKAR